MPLFRASSARASRGLRASRSSLSSAEKKINSDGSGNAIKEDHTRVAVAVRLRPFTDYELERGGRRIVDIHENVVSVINPAVYAEYIDEEKSRMLDYDTWMSVFPYDKCFWSFDDIDPLKEIATQEVVYNEYGPRLIENALNGYNCSVFAYGQTGSGKTYTMTGKLDDDQLAGFIPRLCRDLFAQLKTNSKFAAKDFVVKASYFEIYNERIFDLLTDDDEPSDRYGMRKRKSLRVREHPKNGPFVENLRTVSVSSFDEINKLLIIGDTHRQVAETQVSKISSRSHAIFQLKISSERIYNDDFFERQESHVYLVDLAGSERVDISGASGIHLKETAHINKSLSALAGVVNAITSGEAPFEEKFVPYRDSALTWLLKDALGGNCKTFFIATLSPDLRNYRETLSTLRYAERAKQIINPASANRQSGKVLVEMLQHEVALLRKKLNSYKMLQPGDKSVSDLSDLMSSEQRRMSALEEERNAACSRAEKLEEAIDRLLHGEDLTPELEEIIKSHAVSRSYSEADERLSHPSEAMSNRSYSVWKAKTDHVESQLNEAMKASEEQSSLLVNVREELRGFEQQLESSFTTTVASSDQTKPMSLNQNVDENPSVSTFSVSSQNGNNSKDRDILDMRSVTHSIHETDKEAIYGKVHNLLTILEHTIFQSQRLSMNNHSFTSNEYQYQTAKITEPFGSQKPEGLYGAQPALEVSVIASGVEGNQVSALSPNRWDNYAEYLSMMTEDFLSRLSVSQTFLDRENYGMNVMSAESQNALNDVEFSYKKKLEEKNEEFEGFQNSTEAQIDVMDREIKSYDELLMETEQQVGALKEFIPMHENLEIDFGTTKQLLFGVEDKLNEVDVRYNLNKRELADAMISLDTAEDWKAKYEEKVKELEDINLSMQLEKSNAERHLYETDDLSRKLYLANQKCEEQKQELENLNAAMEVKVYVVDQLSAEKNDLARKLDQANNDFANMKNNDNQLVAEYEKQLQSDRIKFADLNKEIDQLRERVERAEDSKKQSLRNAERVVTDIETKLEHDEEASREKINRLESRIMELEDSLRKLRVMGEEYKKQVIDLDAIVVDRNNLRAKVRKLEDEAKLYRNSAYQWETKHDEKAKEVAQIKKTRIPKDKLISEQSRNEEMKVKISYLQDEMDLERLTYDQIFKAQEQACRYARFPKYISR